MIMKKRLFIDEQNNVAPTNQSKIGQTHITHL